MRLNGVDNEPLGIVSIQDALRLSAEHDVDLVEIAAQADPGVPTDGLRQVQVPRAEKGRRSQVQAKGHRGQGSQVPPRYRRW
ncbi:translation initiation factor [Ideonella paludis]|uniref:hypothetical protein n=1 Tax=Ideonella paludis TaxID=1233411 RepID=UPI0036391D02